MQEEIKMRNSWNITMHFSVRSQPGSVRRRVESLIDENNRKITELKILLGELD